MGENVQQNSDDSPTATTTTKPNTTLVPSLFSKGEIVEVSVGDEGQVYKLHKDLLVAKSPFFATCLKDCWNGKLNSVNLQHDTPEAFEIFIDWLYTATLPQQWYQGEEIPFKTFAGTYGLANKLMVEKLKNDIVDAITTQHKPKGIVFTFSGLLVMQKMELCGTQLYRLGMRSAIRAFMLRLTETGDDSLEMVSQVPELAAGILKSIRDYKIAPWGEIWDADRCEFHEHSDGSKCK